MGEPSNSGRSPPPPPPPPPPLPPPPMDPMSSVHGYGAMPMSYPPPSYGFGGAVNRYGAYGGGGFGGYGGGSYGAGSYGYPPVGQDLSLTRLAEERTRGAFNSLDSLVQAFSSVSMLLESSSTAIQSSFRAVIGVADQFTRLKELFSSLLVSLSFCRFLRWLYRKVLVLLRLRPANFAAESAWASELPKARTDWNSLLFLIISLGGPWLLYRATSSLLSSARESQRWIKGEGPHYEAKALYEYNGTDRSTLSLSTGQLIRVAPKEVQPAMRGWLLASDVEGANVGLVPMNYVKITARHPQSHPANQPNLEALW